jgi:peptidoglycan/LPS O-acetylase OafA/YrhL
LLVRVLETRLLVGAGLVSYSIFLSHEPLARFLQAHGLTFGGTLGFFTNVLVLLLVAGALSYLRTGSWRRPRSG